MNTRTKKILQTIVIYFVLPIGGFLGIVYYQFGKGGFLGVGVMALLLCILVSPMLKSRQQHGKEWQRFCDESGREERDQASYNAMQEHHH